MFKLPFNFPIVRCAKTCLGVVLLFSGIIHAQEFIDASPPTSSTGQSNADLPPIEQAVVPEGIFAMRLAETLNLGSNLDETTAESLLSDAGIEPKNGWISDYPVTPAVIGELEKNLAAAADQGKIKLAKKQALQLLKGETARLGVDVKAGPDVPAELIRKPGNRTIYRYTDKAGIVHFTDELDSVPKEYRDTVKVNEKSIPIEPSGGAGNGESPGPEYAANPDPVIINNYYYEEGPPAVTYYPPPDPYYYLYSWVPYPFWSTGFFFPGFFILHDFHRRMVFDRHPHVVGNHFGDGIHRNPFTNNQGIRLNQDNLVHNPSTHWFNSPRAQAGAREIFMLHQHRVNSTTAANMPQGIGRPPPNRWIGSPRNQPAMLNGQLPHPNVGLSRPSPFNNGRTFNQPSFSQRQFAPYPPRMNSSRVFPQDRTYAPPPRSMGGGGVGGIRGGERSFGGFRGGGGFGGQGGGSGGSFRGGGHR